MTEFTSKYAASIAGALSGFDRLVFRGSLRKIAYPFGVEGYLWANQGLWCKVWAIIYLTHQETCLILSSWQAKTNPRHSLKRWFISPIKTTASATCLRAAGQPV